MQLDYWGEIARIACTVFFSFWPFVFLGGLVRWRGGLSGLLSAFLAVWLILAITRMVIAFDANQLPMFFIQDPTSTLSFLGLLTLDKTMSHARKWGTCEQLAIIDKVTNGGSAG
jgi:hypothetical protein